MKKVFNVFLILAIVLSLAACSSQPKPETTVSEFIEAAKMFDFDKMSSEINPASTPHILQQKLKKVQNLLLSI